MTLGLVGRKLGMTRIFTEAGQSVPVTVVEVLPNRVAQVKTKAKEGYTAVQVTTGTVKASRLNKPESGHFAKAKVEAGRGLWEFPVSDAEIADIALGAEFNADYFSEGQKVDVTAVSKGKGFAGVIKRHNFSMQDATHGNSLSHRAPGSTGQNQTPRRVFKGKRMAGQMGNAQVTTQNLAVVKVDMARQVILIRGAVPGAPGTNVFIRPALKAKSNTATAA
jgi:large subunit ribosomal protein L3